MPVEITVGPVALVINQGSTFMVTEPSGEISSEREHGVFANDTRFLSHYTIFANGERWVRLTSAATSHNTARIHLTNQPFATEEGEVPGGTLALTITEYRAAAPRHQHRVTVLAVGTRLVLP